jgi:hypothetical protein
MMLCHAECHAAGVMSGVECQPCFFFFCQLPVACATFLRAQEAQFASGNRLQKYLTLCSSDVRDFGGTILPHGMLLLHKESTQRIMFDAG